MTLFSRLIVEDDGQNLIEYALLAGLIALAGVTAVTASGTSLSTVYNNISTALSSLPSPLGGGGGS
jgi:pilus assembly protein Flp/PilA